MPLLGEPATVPRRPERSMATAVASLRGSNRGNAWHAAENPLQDRGAERGNLPRMLSLGERGSSPPLRGCHATVPRPGAMVQ